MGFDGANLLDDGGKAVMSTSCSICLEDVTDYKDRSLAKLQCGHQFHLDCIGSAFNVKGVMQCPNCRKIEKGQWLYADSGRSFPEINIEDLISHEDFYDLAYPESSIWCPFGGFSRRVAAVAFEEVEYPTHGYNEIAGQHPDFSDHSATVSSATRMCPFTAYAHPSTSSADVGDGSRYNNNRWNIGQLEIPNSYSFPTMDAHYSTHVDHPPVATRTNIDMPTPGSYVHPFLAGQSSSTRGPSSISSVMNHPHPGRGAPTWERSQAFDAYFQQPSTHIAHRSNTQAHVGSSSDQNHGVYHPTSSRTVNDADNSMLNPFHHIPERDPSHSHPHPYSYPYSHEPGPYHQQGGGSARQRHGSARITSHSQYWS
ncbi:hypothetical protein QVD17_27463 [Tagetes erecta]|uniref:RING-type domain-containing protein n=1 Tax=Tagetes erecta TaxID=13708 RepID=A0AAD8NJH8_TARER|nr:hypothetical protein QVD17_27463 [Tagetes erecta]